MLPIWLGLASYIAVFILMPLAAWLVFRKRVPPVLRAITLVFVCLVAGLSSLLLVGDNKELWPPDLLPFNYPRFTAQIPGYTVTYEQHYSGDYYATVLQLTDATGRSARATLDGDDERCWNLSIVQQGSKFYFVCANDPTIDVGTTYIDTQRQELYIGIARRSFPLATFFEWK